MYCNRPESTNYIWINTQRGRFLPIHPRVHELSRQNVPKNSPNRNQCILSIPVGRDERVEGGHKLTNASDFLAHPTQPPQENSSSPVAARTSWSRRCTVQA